MTKNKGGLKFILGSVFGFLICLVGFNYYTSKEDQDTIQEPAELHEEYVDTESSQDNTKDDNSIFGLYKSNDGDLILFSQDGIKSSKIHNWLCDEYFGFDIGSDIHSYESIYLMGIYVIDEKSYDYKYKELLNCGIGIRVAESQALGELKMDTESKTIYEIPYFNAQPISIYKKILDQYKDNEKPDLEKYGKIFNGFWKVNFNSDYYDSNIYMKNYIQYIDIKIGSDADIYDYDKDEESDRALYADPSSVCILQSEDNIYYTAIRYDEGGIANVIAISYNRGSELLQLHEDGKAVGTLELVDKEQGEKIKTDMNKRMEARPLSSFF